MTRRTLTEEIIAGEHKLRKAGSETLHPYDEDGLPPEPFSSFTESPLDFEEMTLTLYKDLQEVYELTGILNRFSRNYPVACRLLEQLIKRLGSCLVTKAAMEQKDFIFPHLQNLSIEDLYRMISFNFRKTHVAFCEGKEKSGCADMGLLEQECRLADLAERLRATEEKIRQIKAGKVDVDSLLERAKFYRDRRKTSVPAKTGSSRTVKARALPVFNSVIKQKIREDKEWERHQARLRRASGVPMIPPASLKNCIVKSRPEEQPKQEALPIVPPPPVQPKQKSFIADTVRKMLDSRPGVSAPTDPGLQTGYDESMRQTIERHKQAMEQRRKGKKHKPGRA